MFWFRWEIRLKKIRRYGQVWLPSGPNTGHEFLSLQEGSRAEDSEDRSICPRCAKATAKDAQQACSEGVGWSLNLQDSASSTSHRKLQEGLMQELRLICLPTHTAEYMLGTLNSVHTEQLVLPAWGTLSFQHTLKITVAMGSLKIIKSIGWGRGLLCILLFQMKVYVVKDGP